MNTTWRLDAKDEGSTGAPPSDGVAAPVPKRRKACNRDAHAYDVVPYALTGAQFNLVVGVAQVLRDVDALGRKADTARGQRESQDTEEASHRATHAEGEI